MTHIMPHVEYMKDIVTLENQYDAFYTFDVSEIVYNFKLWKRKLPSVAPFYAVKANDNELVLHILAALGIGFDCSSKQEIEMVMNIGVEPSRVIYANPCKQQSSLIYATSLGIDCMTFDNALELHKIKEICPHAQLVIRILVDNSMANVPLGGKFGCDLTEVKDLLNLAKILDLNVIGVSFHIGSNCKNVRAYTSAILQSRQIFDTAHDMGYDFTLLDIGGGFPSSRRTELTFEEIADAINETLGELFPPETGVKVIAEPGRYFIASAFNLCTSIIAKRVKSSPNGELSSANYYINDGIFGSLYGCRLNDVELPPVPLFNTKSEENLPSTLYGPTCSSEDRVCKCCYLPEMNIGDWLIFHNNGAYSLSIASTFNGLHKPQVKPFISSKSVAQLHGLQTWSMLSQSLKKFNVKILGSEERENGVNGVNGV